ncbi:N-acetylornithine carbamoyltransferase [Tenacibaculum maritimum]|nr:N-acetylornithine carbamoyltransferase [Tenacibaculum maritimum]CAA0205855.1 N-acetylornithine carbamoyltransferase [Tenacibaculum maritimum]CAA0208539.1 N-acetylornithine carbamoyltransferase [Tenacibaculum maritimum]
MMKKYTSLNDIEDVSALIQKAICLKKNPFAYKSLGRDKTLVMLFFNSSLRTRLSTEKAAKNLGMEVMILNINNAWGLEFEEHVIMNFDKAEHIKEAAKVISQYATIIGIRAFPNLKDRNRDASEYILNGFQKYASVPIVNLESATRHPLQALADVITIEELKTKEKPKVVLSWAPHPKALPQSVVNSFIKMMRRVGADFTITHPQGYELNSKIIREFSVNYNQKEALKNADFVYVKNWSSYTDYGKVLNTNTDWMLTKEKIGTAKLMHCLPVRRNVVIEDAVLDGENAIVIQQANNRTYAAQIVLKELLENL